MPDRENVIYDIERCICHVPDACRDCSHYGHGEVIGCMEELLTDALAMLKEQEVEKPVMPWNVLGRLDDGTYKGKCGNCGFVHYFIEGHDAQYKFCPQCGEQKQEL